jgi:PKHD-type hydroxylase
MYTFRRNVSGDPIQWYWFQNGFSQEEIQQIIHEATTWPLKNAGVSQAGIIDSSIRKSSTSWVPKTDANLWLYTKLGNMITEANNALWNFDLFAMNEEIQYTEYYQDGGHYDYHLDIGGGDPLNQRKISITVQLSGPDEYEGGDFQIIRGKNPETLPKEKGCVLVFPSYILHRVTPVTAGTRRSLVLWVGGSSFR